MKKMLCTSFGLGLLPKAPGTWGSLLPLLVVLGCGHFQCAPSFTISVLLLLVLASSAVTIALADWYRGYFGKKDPSQVVSDEVAGQSIALLGMAWIVPPLENPVRWIGLAVLAFVLFRIFDIWKPGLIDRSQRLPSGWGVLTDDILGGIAACCIVLAVALR